MTADGSSTIEAGELDRAVPVVEAIRDAIVNGAFAPRQRLIEITEVRMVVEGLCAAKAAERLTDADRERLRGIGTAMQQAVATGDLFGYSELNKQLHALIRSLSGQTTANAVLERLRGQNVRHQFRLAMQPGRPSVSLPQHLEIIDALCAGDPDAAEAAVRRHLSSVIGALPSVEEAGGRERFDAL
jgi:DNA-binding GntR family transcriptional regulator